MSSATAIAPPTRTGFNWRRLTDARNALASAIRQGAQMVSAARNRYRSPALTISGFGCIDAAAWHTYGLGAGLLVLGALALVFEWLTGDA